MSFHCLRLSLLVCLSFVFSCTEYELTPEYYECKPAWRQEINSAHPKGHAYQAALDQLVKVGIPGLIMLIKTPEDGIWAGAAGKADLFLDVDMRVCNKTRVASITKTFVSTLTLMLAEAGQLNLDDPLADYVPHEICKNVANCPKATIRQALGHTAGLPCYQDPSNVAYWLDFYNNPGKVWSREDFLVAAYGLEAAFEPGSGYKYTNVGHILMSYVIDKASGQYHEDALQEYIFDKLSLEDTSYRPHGPDPGGIIRGYRDRYGDGVFEDCSHISPQRYHTLVSSVYDIARFIEALGQGLLIDQASLTAMKTGTAIDSSDWERSYGLGLQVANTVYGEVIGHPGGLEGYNTNMLHFPDAQVTFVLFVNEEHDVHQALWDFKQFTRDNPRPEIFELIFE